MRNILFVQFLFLFPLVLQAQETIPISKEEVLVKVKENNNTIKMSQQDVWMAKGDFDQTNEVVLPNIDISHTGIATTNPLMAFGSKLNQGILTQADFNPDLLNNPGQTEDYATRIQIQHPLLNIDGLYQRKAAKSKLYATELRSERTGDFIDLEAYKAYMQLQLAYKTITVLEKVKASALENKRIAINSFEQGYLQKSDILAVEVRLTEIENQLHYARSDIQNVSDNLSVLMNTSIYAIYRPLDSLIINEGTISYNDPPEDRADIQAMEFTSKAYQQLLKADKMSFLPRLNIFGTYELHDDGIFQGDTDGYLLGAELKLNLFDGGKRFGKTKKSKAEYERSKLELEQYRAQSQVDLNKAKRMLQDAKNHLGLISLALEQSLESLRIRTNRFEQGLEKTTDLLQAEIQYAQKQLEYYTTVFNHNYVLAYSQYLTKRTGVELGRKK